MRSQTVPNVPTVPPTGNARTIWVSIRARTITLFTLVYLLVFVLLFILLNLFADQLIRKNAPQLLGDVATPEFVQRIVDTFHSQLDVVTLITFVVIYLVVIGLLLVIGYGMSRPLRLLTHYAQQIEAGDYSPAPLSPAGRIRDEFTILNEAFAIMVEKVQSREANLKQQVMELQIVIDHSRQAQQVEEITDSEFFSNLKARAHELRQNKAEPEDKAKSADS